MEKFHELSDEELDKVIGGVSNNWAAVGQCLMTNGATAIPALNDLVQAVVNKDWVKVSILCQSASISSIPLVAKCLLSK